VIAESGKKQTDRAPPITPFSNEKKGNSKRTAGGGEDVEDISQGGLEYVSRGSSAFTTNRKIGGEGCYVGVGGVQITRGHPFT